MWGDAMFIFTAKFDKKKAVIAVILLAVILIAIILVAAKRDNSPSSNAAALSAIVKNNEQRIEYLNSLGWDVSEEPIEEETIVIPREFNDVYKEYNNLQISQGFDLSDFGGIEATRYTYKVFNYPDMEDNVVVDIIVYRNEIIAGDVQSIVINGFMQGLEMPAL